MIRSGRQQASPFWAVVTRWDTAMKQHVLSVLIGISAWSAFAEEPLPQALPLEQEQAALRSAERIGRSMFRHDHAAAVATDALFAETAAKKEGRVRGWITETRQDDIVVTFVDDSPAALYRVTVSAEGRPGPVTTYTVPEPLSAYEAAAARARLAAMSATFEPCAQNYNSVVLPAEAGADAEAPWRVYMLPGTTRHDVVPIGGSYRFETKDGAMVSQRAFTRTCITLPRNPGKGGVLMITHLLDPVPTEVHVFWSLWAGAPMMVATPPDGTIWGIENGRIELIERRAAKK